MPLESFHTTPPDASFTGTGSAAWVAAHNLRMEGGGFLVGRETAGTGAPENIAVGANLTLSGGTLSAAAGTGGGAVNLVVGVAPILVTGTSTSTVALNTSGVTAGTYGGALIIPRFDISAQGLVVGGTNAGTLGTMATFQSYVAAGDILGTSTTGTFTAALSTTGVTAGTYGNGTSVGQFVVDAKGRISLATNVTVAGGNSAFGAITSGTNTSAAMVVASGASIVASGSGSIMATHLPDGTAAGTSGAIAYNQTTEELNYFNGQRALTDEVGWSPFAVPLWHVGGGTNQITLAALSGSDAGALAIPIHITGHMLLDGLFIRSQVAATARSAEWRIYRQRLNNGNSGENTLDFVPGTDGTFSYTPSAASNEYSALASPAYLAPGAYWLVIRNSHATSTFILGAAAAPVLATNLYQTKSIPALGSTLDFVAATWTKGQSVMNLMLKGRVFGETAAF